MSEAVINLPKESAVFYSAYNTMLALKDGGQAAVTIACGEFSCTVPIFPHAPGAEDRKLMASFLEKKAKMIGKQLAETINDCNSALDEKE